jgi:hypothetical protein
MAGFAMCRVGAEMAIGENDERIKRYVSIKLVTERRTQREDMARALSVHRSFARR